MTPIAPTAIVTVHTCVCVARDVTILPPRNSLTNAIPLKNRINFCYGSSNLKMPSRRAKLRLSGTAPCVKSKCLAMSKRSSHYHETRLTGRRESRRSRLISGTSSSWKHTPTKSQILAAFLGRGWDKHSAEYCDFNEETQVTISFPTARPACSPSS